MIKEIKKQTALKIKIFLIQVLVAIFCLKKVTESCCHEDITAYSYQPSNVFLLLSFKKVLRK